MRRMGAVVCWLLVGSACAGREINTTETTTTASASASTEAGESLFRRGRELAQQGDASRAQQYLELAIQAGYPESRAIVPLVQVCVAAFRLRAALDYAHAYLKRDPAAFRLRYLVAAIHAALGQADLAATELRRVLAQRPNAAQAHYLLGVLERDAFGDEAAARARFVAYLEHDPGGAFDAEVRAWLLEHPERAARTARVPASRVHAGMEHPP